MSRPTQTSSSTRAAASTRAEDPILLLMIEDDARLAELTRRYLERHNVRTSWRGDGERGLEEALRGRYDAVALDLTLPGRDGLSICRALRERSSVPILMVTARGDEADRVLGLESGADDYILKPFSSRELLARVRAQVRRARGHLGPRRPPLRIGALALDPGRRRATLDGRALALTNLEFNLLYAMAERAGHALEREQLLRFVHGSAEEAFDRSIDVHVSRLRRKLGENPRRPQLLLTVRGVGYMLAPGARRGPARAAAV